MEGFGFIKVCPEDLLGFKVVESLNTSDIKLEKVEKFVATGDHTRLRVFVRDGAGKWVRGKIEKVSGIRYKVYILQPLGLFSTYWKKLGLVEIDYKGEVSEIMQVIIAHTWADGKIHSTTINYGMKSESDIYEKALESLGQIKNGGKSPVWIEWNGTRRDEREF